MTTKTLNNYRRLNREISSLKHEVAVLRSVIIGFLGRDKEGEYRPEFVKRVLKASREKPRMIFKDKKSFLKEIL